MQIDTDNIIQRLAGALNGELPGKNAHKIMMPQGRNLEPLAKTEPRLSAVLLLLHIDSDALYITMIKRAEYDGVHSGQIAFPGGKKEEYDDNLRMTALRETYEEVGVRQEDVKMIGKLTPLYIPVSNMCVHPWVGFHRNIPLFVKQDKEVQQILSLPLGGLIENNAIETDIFEGINYRIEAPCYKINGYKVWGASAMILNEFIEIWRNSIEIDKD
ncbi:MAG: CoA pyrophosphatase [Salinivirgaceae bacterium]|jgi:8-oxo-dGTP pyrophosphatase MutT (NUDIX family)|nr:CoA pyrophosphatase [Salinivirgaceae bacterium]